MSFHLPPLVPTSDFRPFPRLAKDASGAGYLTVRRAADRPEFARVPRCHVDRFSGEVSRFPTVSLTGGKEPYPPVGSRPSAWPGKDSLDPDPSRVRDSLFHPKKRKSGAVLLAALASLLAKQSND